MQYEITCEVQIIIAKMYELVDVSEELMGSNQKQLAISTLNKALDLESEIPTQFRDRRRLQYLHSHMNQLREDFYR